MGNNAFVLDDNPSHLQQARVALTHRLSNAT